MELRFYSFKVEVFFKFDGSFDFEALLILNLLFSV